MCAELSLPIRTPDCLALPISALILLPTRTSTAVALLMAAGGPPPICAVVLSSSSAMLTSGDVKDMKRSAMPAAISEPSAVPPPRL